MMEKSPLGRLPAELRNCIYELVLTVSNADAPAIFKLVRSRKSDGYLITMEKTHTNTPPITLIQTCRAVHNEAAGLFFKLNIFRVVDNYSTLPMESFFDFLDLIGDDALSSIQALEVQFRGDNCLCMKHPECLAKVDGLRDLRKWSLMHPQVPLSAHFYWHEKKGFARIDVQKLDTPFVQDVEGYFERTFGRAQEVRRRLQLWQEALSRLTVQDALNDEAE